MPFFARATRSASILTLTGHAFEVVEGKTYQFPDVVRDDVILAGGVLVDPSEYVPEPPALSADAPDAPAVDPAAEALRAEQIYQAVSEVIAKGDARNLLPEGYPKAAALKKLLGFEPTIDEIVAATERVQQVQ